MSDIASMTVLLSTAYFPPVQWFQKVLLSDRALVEANEHFQKQTFRNRCQIASPGGVQDLVVPIERGVKDIRSIRISDHGSWRHLHLNAIRTAYGESPFFEYYIDDILPFFERRYDFLFDFNQEITAKMLALLDLGKEPPQPTDHFRTVEEAQAQGIDDFRFCIRPKNAPRDPDFRAKEYQQVIFQGSANQKFKPNLSVLDLLFNEGAEAALYL